MNWYYLNSNNEAIGPVSTATLQELRAVGAMTADTRICKEGTEEWLPFDQASSLEPDPARGEATPPLYTRSLPGWRTATAPALHEKVIGNIKVFGRRIAISNFIGEGVTEDERKVLIEAGINSPMSQNYLAWRRALLWFAAATLAIVVVLRIGSYFTDFDELPGILQFVMVVLFVAQIATCGLAALAAVRWSRVESTRSLARFSWFCLFLVPLLLFLIPVGRFIGADDFANEQERLGFIATIGILYSLSLLPKLIGLFPALIRSSLTLKTLLPESPMPGWIAVIIAPLYALFLAVVLVVVVQVENLWLSIAIGALTLSPTRIVLCAGRLVQPCDEKQAMANVTQVRRSTWILNGIGLAAGIAFAIEILTKYENDITAGNILEFACSIAGSFLLLTVVTSDLLIGLFKVAFDRERTMRDDGLEDRLQSRFTDLEALGLTDVRAGERELISAIGRKLKGSGNSSQDSNSQE